MGALLVSYCPVNMIKGIFLLWKLILQRAIISHSWNLKRFIILALAWWEMFIHTVLDLVFKNNLHKNVNLFATPWLASIHWLKAVDNEVNSNVIRTTKEVVLYDLMFSGIRFKNFQSLLHRSFPRYVWYSEIMIPMFWKYFVNLVINKEVTFH